MPKIFLNKLNNLVSLGKISEAIILCKNSNNVYSKVAQSILLSQGKTRKEIERIAEDEGARQVFRLSQSNDLLGALSNISTLLGLLGTISGMITVFQVISTQTVVDPPSLAGGISEALYTTALGLIVAIPIFIGYKFINNRVSEISNKLQEEAQKLISELVRIIESK